MNTQEVYRILKDNGVKISAYDYNRIYLRHGLSFSIDNIKGFTNDEIVQYVHMLEDDYRWSKEMDILIDNLNDLHDGLYNEFEDKDYTEIKERKRKIRDKLNL